MIPQPIMDLGAVGLAIFATILSLMILWRVLKMQKDKKKKAPCVESDCMKTMHLNSVHNREVLDVIVGMAREQVKESVKQTTLLKIIARNGKGHLLDL